MNNTLIPCFHNTNYNIYFITDYDRFYYQNQSCFKVFVKLQQYYTQ